MRSPHPCFVLTVLILMATASIVRAEGPPGASTGQVLLTAEDAMADIALARDNLERLHAGYDRYASTYDLSRSWDRMVELTEHGIERGQLYLELSRLLAELRCDHTKAELPKDMEALRSTEQVYLPFRFVLFDRRMFVEVATRQVGLKRGDEILSIDGHEVDWWLQQIEPLVPVDGYAHHVKRLEIAYSTEFMGPAFDHFAPFLVPLKETVKLKLRNTAGETRQMVLPRQTYVEFQDMVGEKRYTSNFADSVRYERLGDDAAYLAVDTFVNYRKPVDPVAHLAPYFKRLKDEGRSKLIVDLRRNGGGSNDAQVALLRHLITDSVTQIEARLTRFNSISDEQRRHIDTWDESALYPDQDWFEIADNGYFKIIKPELLEGTGMLTPAADAFDGEIVVLTGPSNSSGSTHLIAALTAANRITRVGERTGGSPTGATAGTILFLTLPKSGIRIRIPVVRTVIANADSLPSSNGLDPDVFASMTPDAWFADRDPAMEAAIQLLD